MQRQPRAPLWTLPAPAPPCCPAHQVGLAQALSIGQAARQTFGAAQWKAAATWIVEAMQEPRPCLLCGQPPLLCGMCTPDPPAVWGQHAVLYFLCAACGARPPKERVLRVEAMLARAMIGRKN